MSTRVRLPASIAALVVLLCVAGRGLPVRRVRQNTSLGAEARAQDVEVMIVLSRNGGRPFRVGEEITIEIYMKNKRDVQVIACLAKYLLQIRPSLVKDGQPVPYLNGLNEFIAKQKAENSCKSLSELPGVQDRDLSDEENKDPNITEPDILVLTPNELRVVSSLALFDKSELIESPNQFIWSSWYAPLHPGRYELTIERSLDCCGGPSVKSNTVNFEVVPRGND